VVGLFGLICKTGGVSSQSAQVLKPFKSKVITNRYLAYELFGALGTAHSLSADWLIALAVWLLRNSFFFKQNLRFICQKMTKLN